MWREQVVSKFGIIGHFVGMEHFWDIITTGYPKPIKKRNKDLILKILEWTPAFETPLTLHQKSVIGSKIIGYPVMCPLMARQMLLLDEEFVLDKISAAVNKSALAGAKLAVLTGFNSVVGNQGEEVAKRVNIPVTTGNSYTSALTIKGVKKAAKLIDMPLENAKVAILGATGDIGSVCTKILSKLVPHISIVARKKSKLEEFAEELTKTGSAEIEVHKKASEAVKDKDIIIAVTSSVTTIIDVEDIKSGAIVCDVAIPKNIAVEVSKKRNDVLVFDGGVTELIQDVYFPGITMGYMVGCIAEGMILAMEHKYESYSIGRGNITPEKVFEIDQLGTKHGFRLDNLKIGNKIYKKRDIKRIKKNIKLNKN